MIIDLIWLLNLNGASTKKKPSSRRQRNRNRVASSEVCTLMVTNQALFRSDDVIK